MSVGGPCRADVICSAAAKPGVKIAVIAVDPYTGELRYSSAGHPPPLVVDRATGEVTRLDLAGAPPVGIAEPSDIVEASFQLPGAAALALYTSDWLSASLPTPRNMKGPLRCEPVQVVTP